MLAVPEVNGADVAFGGVKHMPKYDAIPEEFKRFNGNDYVRAISFWFFKGAKRNGDAIVIDGKTFKPREGVNANKALNAIKAVLSSWEPKHEHKEAACAFMLSEWFELSK